MLSDDHDPLLRITLTNDGEVHVHPGYLLGPEHIDLMVETAGRVQDAVSSYLPAA